MSSSSVIVIDLQQSRNLSQSNENVELQQPRVKTEDDEVVFVLEAGTLQHGTHAFQEEEEEEEEEEDEEDEDEEENSEIPNRYWRNEAESEEEHIGNEVIELDEEEVDNVDSEAFGQNDNDQQKIEFDQRRQRKRARADNQGTRIIDLTTDTPIKQKRTCNDQNRPLEKKTQEDIIEELKKQLQCPVCQDDIDEFSSTKCGHIFCWSCACQVVNSLKKCPTCRTQLDSKDIHRIYF